MNEHRTPVRYPLRSKVSASGPQMPMHDFIVSWP